MAKTRRIKPAKSSKRTRASSRVASGMAPLQSGPPKKRKRGVPEARLSNHKARTAWFRSRVTWPYREAPIEAMIRERQRAKQSLAASLARWETAGPSNIGGRMTSLVCHPTDSDIIWAGAAGGGVWTSKDAGKTWTSLWHSQEVLNVGSLAIDPANPETIYCGTGEANLSADSSAGVGIYRSIDAGKTWHLLAESSATGIPTRIGVIAIDPFNSRHLRIRWCWQ